MAFYIVSLQERETFLKFVSETINALVFKMFEFQTVSQSEDQPSSLKAVCVDHRVYDYTKTNITKDALRPEVRSRT